VHHFAFCPKIILAGPSLFDKLSDVDRLENFDVFVSDVILTEKWPPIGVAITISNAAPAEQYRESIRLTMPLDSIQTSERIAVSDN
jgi:hypothetical protein